ncbi:hypothetical protein F5X68DRAFT_78317 [Plectosphaerella plurivora]|uniref:Exoribonuclease phosphorolytic domain-containing protein n=1 Tax=Plectosphaerella plurivora TaxID=936078 RepID=A0A9P8VEL5_9PEZI|nr:hypothetical protein F5X68DRAFT_78317 [Plectosphaerella plurivora]
MAARDQAEGRLSLLHRTDGSATFSFGGYTIIASVNGPIEAQRREENPFEAVLDVVVRPAAGVGGTRERQLESMLQAVLRQLVLVQRWPRCVFQVTLQIAQNPTNDYVNSKVVQAQSNILAFPALLHAAQLALLSGAVALKSIAAAVVVALPQGFPKSSAIVNPSPLAANEATSLHLVGFSQKGSLLLTESEGRFTEADWEAAIETGRQSCQSNGANAVGEDETPDMGQFLRSITEARLASDLNWR